MQPKAIFPRNNLTTAQVDNVIRDSADLSIQAGMELINRNLVVIEDISRYLQDGLVKRNSYATLHGNCSFSMTQELSWESAIVRPYMILSSGTISARFNLGAYFTNAPEHKTGNSPTVYSVEAYDILDALNTPVGDSYAINAGTSYLEAIQSILNNQNYTKYIIDPSRAATTLPVARGWAMSENPTWLGIVNDLLGAIGYRGVYSDWDGFLVCEPYDTPESKLPEWTYNDGEYTSQFDPVQIVKHDYYNTPNKWVGVRSNQIEGATPVEGDGKFTYTNEYDGKTSIEARNRTIVAPILNFEVADQAALVSRVMQQASKDKAVGTTIEALTTHNPLHWHFDVIEIDTSELGLLKVLETEWSIPLTDNGWMSHNWTVL